METSFRPRPHAPGLQHLPREVLVRILQCVREAAGGEDGQWQESFLVPLRLLCRGLQGAVDACLTSRTLVVRPPRPRDARTLLLASDWLHLRTPRWPFLTSLRLDFDWPPDYLQFALLTLSRRLPLLSCLALSAPPAPVPMPPPDAQDTATLDISVLRSLASLSSLSISGFERYPPLWGESLASLTSVQDLELVDSGVFQLLTWPNLRRLALTARSGKGYPTNEIEAVTYRTPSVHLVLVPGLHHLSVVLLSLPDYVARALPDTLESLVFKGGDSVKDPVMRAPPNLRSLKLHYIQFECVEGLVATARRLTALEVVDVVFSEGDGEPGPVSLGHLFGLRSLVWRGNESLPRGIGSLTALQELVLSDNTAPHPPDLGALVRLETLSISGANNMSEWPVLAGMTRLTALTLANIDAGNYGCPEDLSALVSLESLVLENFDCVEMPELSTLTRLTSVTFGHCGMWARLPEMKHLTRLQTLHVRTLDNLLYVPDLPGSLTSLSLDTCVYLKQMPVLLPTRGSHLHQGLESGPQIGPNALQRPTRPVDQLRQLTLQFVPDHLVTQVAAFESLEELTLDFFPNLTSLPSLQSLRALRSLTISRWPLLQAVDVRQFARLQRIKVSDCKLLERVMGLCDRVTCTVEDCPQLRSFNKN